MGDFESLATALDPWLEKSFGELPSKLGQLVAKHFLFNWDNLTPAGRLSVAMQVDYHRDPANECVQEFWLEVPFRKRTLVAMRLQAQNVAAPDAIALAKRNLMLFHIDEAIEALPRDEAEVQSATPAELKATIETVRRRWKEHDRRVVGLGPDVCSPASAAEHRPDDAELKAWLAHRLCGNPLASDAEITAAHRLASDAEITAAAMIRFGKENISGNRIIALRQLPDGKKRPTGPKPRKAYTSQS